MAGSFERKVRKNMEKVNEQRRKQGGQIIGSSTGTAGDTYYGRNVTVPIMLLGLSILYLVMTMFWTKVGMRGMDWLVFGLYVLLAVVFFIRRPYLRVGKTGLYTLKGGRERSMTVDQIKSIKVQSGYVIVERQGKGGNWVFNKTLGRYDTVAIAERLEKFAAANQLPFHSEVTKS
ncbi:hypothetical protein OIN60_17940 [Paenibacillus sp. P96]|uniref:Methyltransferase n=1 Tax=Paenibacillus zeirhizosphaerae TaxID=2987519 RepID=A0ABT9FV54_9BACL|nr:hypothetical protein [Paenibacillus sp. P96]MDP4098617.1 hypothetical protein [Paenibacillus sp. P96]